jgi:hypothetical protein
MKGCLKAVLRNVSLRVTDLVDSELSAKLVICQLSQLVVLQVGKRKCYFTNTITLASDSAL